MAEREVQKRLAAILAADVAGYTRLMEKDTDGTVAAWQDARDDVIKPCVADFSGKVVKLTGDGFLVEFPTVQGAVNCAIALQQDLATSSLDFRMGVNLGDIVDDGEYIHGEGVNVAARLEGLAEPGGIVISGDVFNQVHNRFLYRALLWMRTMPSTFIIRKRLALRQFLYFDKSTAFLTASTFGFIAMAALTLLVQEL